MEFVLPGTNIKLIIADDKITEMLNHISHSTSKETGGILVGHYSQDQLHAIVTKITGPPKDSLSGSHWFQRGVHGLKNLLNSAWKYKQYYLGEWHSHTLSLAVNASSRDSVQMMEIAFSSAYQCPEPILLIIAGTPNNYSVTAYLAVRKTAKINKMNPIY